MRVCALAAAAVVSLASSLASAAAFVVSGTGTVLDGQTIDVLWDGQSASLRGDLTHEGHSMAVVGDASTSEMVVWLSHNGVFVFYRAFGGVTFNADGSFVLPADAGVMLVAPPPGFVRWDGTSVARSMVAGVGTGGAVVLAGVLMVGAGYAVSRFAYRYAMKATG